MSPSKFAGLRENWALNAMKPEAIAAAADNLIRDVKATYDAVGALKPDEITFASCIKPLIDVECVRATRSGPLDFAQNCASDKSVRDASVEAAKKLDEFSVEISMRKDVFDNVTLFRDKVGLQGLTEEQKRFVDKEIVHGKRNGLHLPEETRDEVTRIKKRISELGTDYHANLNEDVTALEFSREALAGVPEDLVGTFEKGSSEGKLKVTMKYPHFFPVTRKCSVAETRKAMEVAYMSRCVDANTKILEELIQLRQKQAELLGYKNHAAYVQELRMAKKPEHVSKFLSDIAAKLQPVWKKEQQAMLKLKEDECKKLGVKFSGKLDFWDIRYYVTQVEELHYAVDQEKLKEYFPMEKVTKGLLEIYQQLLGLKFVECPNAEAWHPDVTLFRVEDAASKENIGYFFLDLHPRDGKYGHAAIFDLQPSCQMPDGTRQVGVCAMMTNFAKPTAEKPSLLTHDEVETYFHEFGHVMHMLCSRTETARFRGTHVERDFVEAPSQMLENWVWEEESLAKMSGHYKTNEAIPRELLDKLLASRKANAGGFNLRQVILATFDQKAHTTGKVDTMKMFADTYEDVLGIRPIEGTNMPANWGHMVGYDAQYYGYLWSEVFSADMFATRFKAEGLLNPEVGQSYRQKVLQPGGSKDADQLLKDFLGREANDKAFLEAKGLSAS